MSDLQSFRPRVEATEKLGGRGDCAGFSECEADFDRV